MAVVPSMAWSDKDMKKARCKESAVHRVSTAFSKKLGLSKKKDLKEPTEEPVCVIFIRDEFDEPRDSRKNRSTSSTASTRSGSPASAAPSLPGSVDEQEFPDQPSARSRSSSVSRGSRASSKGSRASSKQNTIGSTFSADAHEVQRIARMINEAARSRCAVDRYRPVRDAFLAVDGDGDGQISAVECVALFRHFGLCDELALRFHALMDRNGTGSMNWREFMAMFSTVFQKKDGLLTEPPDCRTWCRCPSVNGQQWYFS